LDSSGTAYGPVVVSCEYGNKTSGPTKCGELLKQLINYLLFKQDCPLESAMGAVSIQDSSVPKLKRFTEQIHLS
jgi:hypothetical protein